MANRNPPPPPHATRFKPGQSGNPGGKRPLPPELQAIRDLTGTEVRRLFAKWARMTRSELQEALNRPDTPILELAIGSGLAQAAKEGDFSRLAFFLDRTIGKAPAEDPSEADEDEQRSRFSTMSNEELLKFVQTQLPNAGA